MVMEHRSIGHFLCKRVLENVFDLGKRRLLVQKLFGLQRGQEPDTDRFQARQRLGARGRAEIPGR